MSASVVVLLVIGLEIVAEGVVLVHLIEEGKLVKYAYLFLSLVLDVTPAHHQEDDTMIETMGKSFVSIITI